MVSFAAALSRPRCRPGFLLLIRGGEEAVDLAIGQRPPAVPLVSCAIRQAAEVPQRVAGPQAAPDGRREHRAQGVDDQVGRPIRRSLFALLVAVAQDVQRVHLATICQPQRPAGAIETRLDVPVAA